MVLVEEPKLGLRPTKTGLGKENPIRSKEDKDRRDQETRDASSNRSWTDGVWEKFHAAADNKKALDDLEAELDAYDPVHQFVIDKANSAFWKRDSRKARELLLWMLQTEREWFKRKATANDSKFGGKKPLHLAIEKKNMDFLECYLRQCNDPSAGSAKSKAIKALEEKDGDQQSNCLHAAIREKLVPHAAEMISLCSEATLTDTDRNRQTPFHTAIKESDPANGHQLFNKVLEAMEARDIKLKSQQKAKKENKEDQQKEKEEAQGGLLSRLLMHTDKDGKSPYLESFQRLQRLKDEHERAKKRTFAFGDGSVSKETASRNVKSEEDLLKRLNDIIYQTFEVTRILDLSRALYGTQGSEKDLCLDMSDFNQSSYNFRNFVRRFTNLDPTTDPEVSDETAAKGVRLKLFEEKLFYVTLPNLNSIRKPCPHEGVRTLFWWLHHCQNVNWIKTLTIPDSTTSPMSDELLSEAVMQKFQIEEFDWRKLDISLDILTESPHAAHFRTITLYSSGNWSTMYHWILSNDGLAKLPNVSKVNLRIVHLNPSEGVHDKKARDHHDYRVIDFETQLKSRLLELKTAELQKREEYPTQKKLNFLYQLDIDPAAKWEFPVLKYNQDNELHVPKVQFIDQLVYCQNYIDTFRQLNDKDDDIVRRFKEIALEPKAGAEDKRIKVAIIDNGVDKLEDRIKEQIAKGISYVTADGGSSHRMLPWWMVADPHGTHMASLVAQANPYCRLYIARVGKGRKDILTEHAVKAIQWAMEQGVDIISISWTTKKEDEKLKEEIKKAVSGSGPSGKRALVFCSVADEGNYSGDVFPVQWHKDDILSVAATDTYGHLTPASKRAGGEVSIQVPGESIAAEGPSYRDADSSKTNLDGSTPVSGSSVATALAAGIASLALVMLHTYNDLTKVEWEDLHKKSGMKKVFDKMQGQEMGIQLRKLFPTEFKDEDIASLWNKASF